MENSALQWFLWFMRPESLCRRRIPGVFDVPYHVGRILFVDRPWIVDERSILQLAVDVDDGVQQ